MPCNMYDCYPQRIIMNYLNYERDDRIYGQDFLRSLGVIRVLPMLPRASAMLREGGLCRVS
jgi:hypothetical protein